jgi:hypothetical protein
MSANVFPLPPPGKFALLFPVFIGLLMPLAMLGLALAVGVPRAAWPGVAAGIMVLPPVAWAIAASIRNRLVEVLPEGLRVRRWPRAKIGAYAGFDLAGARIVDLDREPAMRPTFKLAGTWLPGFRSGWFWLRDRRRAYVLLTTARRVLFLPRHDGSAWLLGVERPDALLAALRARG